MTDISRIAVVDMVLAAPHQRLLALLAQKIQSPEAFKNGIFLAYLNFVWIISFLSHDNRYHGGHVGAFALKMD